MHLIVSLINLFSQVRLKFYENDLKSDTLMIYLQVKTASKLKKSFYAPLAGKLQKKKS
jgi:hypothetical protein